MKVQEHEVTVRGLGSLKSYEAWLDFKDYDKIFQYLRWRTPIGYHAYPQGRCTMEGIVAEYSDGTEEQMSFIQLRNLLERNWYHLKAVLREEGGEDLDRYTETFNGCKSLGGETLTLKCGKITFQTHPAGCCGFNRIMGYVM